MPGISRKAVTADVKRSNGDDPKGTRRSPARGKRPDKSGSTKSPKR